MLHPPGSGDLAGLSPSVKASLEGTLAGREAGSGAQLAQTQELISTIEAQLSDVRADTERQKLEYQQLADNQESTAYRNLFKGQDAHHNNLPTTNTACVQQPPGLPASSRGMNAPG